MSQDDDFLSRWSRRKRAVATEEAAPEPDTAAPPEDPGPTAQAEETEEEALQRLGLPDPDTMEEGDDFTGFLKAGVPEALRRRALRKLWRTNPVLANVDGLVDYGGDFTDAALVPDVLATVYKVGQGMIKKMTEEEEILAQEDSQLEDGVVASDDSTSADVPEDQELATDTAEEDAKSVPSDPDHPEKIAFADDEGDDVATPRPRRMRFSNT